MQNVQNYSLGKIRFPERMIFEDYYVNPYVVTTAKKIIVNEKRYYFYDRTNENSIMNNVNMANRYDLFLVELPKLEVAQGEFLYLRGKALNRVFKEAFQTYNGDSILRFLSKEQRRELEKFFLRYKNERKLLNFANRLYLWGYLHCRLINIVKGIEYYFKWKNLKTRI